MGLGNLPTRFQLQDRARRFTRASFHPRGCRVGASHFMFQDRFDYPVRDSAFGIPLETTTAALQRIRDELLRTKYHPCYPLGVRFLGATTKTELSLNSGRDTTVIELVSMREFAGFDGARRVFEDVMRGFDGRPHWAKEFERSGRDAYPAETCRRFAELCRRWGSKFCNTWARELTPCDCGPEL